MDLNGNGNCADLDPRENIRYELTGPTATCPGSTIIRRNGDCLVANVVAGPAVLFTYYDGAGNALGATPNLVRYSPRAHRLFRAGEKSRF